MPKMYRSTPAPELIFTKLPSFMTYEVGTIKTGNGIEVQRAVRVDKCGDITEGEFKVWFKLRCGNDVGDSTEILLSI